MCIRDRYNVLQDAFKRFEWKAEFQNKLVNNLDENKQQDQVSQEPKEEIVEAQNPSPEQTVEPSVEPELDSNGKPRRKLNKKAYICGITLLIVFFVIAIYRTHVNGFGMIVQTVNSYTYRCV